MERNLLPTIILDYYLLPFLPLRFYYILLLITTLLPCRHTASYRPLLSQCVFYSATATQLNVASVPKLISYGNYIEI